MAKVLLTCTFRRECRVILGEHRSRGWNSAILQADEDGNTRDSQYCQGSHSSMWPVSLRVYARVIDSTLVWRISLNEITVDQGQFLETPTSADEERKLHHLSHNVTRLVNGLRPPYSLIRSQLETFTVCRNSFGNTMTLMNQKYIKGCHGNDLTAVENWLSHKGDPLTESHARKRRSAVDPEAFFLSPGWKKSQDVRISTRSGMIDRIYHS